MTQQQVNWPLFYISRNLMTMMTVTATATAMNSKYTFNLRHEALSKHTYTHTAREGERDNIMSVLHAFRAIFLLFSFLDFFVLHQKIKVISRDSRHFVRVRGKRQRPWKHFCR